MAESAAQPSSFTPVGAYATDTVAADVPRAADGTKARLAGRIVLWRTFGGLVFGHILDRSGRVQISLRRDRLGAEAFTELGTAVKLGDFIGTE
jgi:lysyl-tRNA synthetase class 2